MNLTLGNATVNSWKRVKAQHVLAAAGITLAVSAALAFGSWDPRNSASPAVSGRAASPVIFTQPAQSRIVYYLTGSEDQAQMVLDGERLAAIESSSVGMPVPSAKIIVLAAPSAEDVMGLRAALASAGQEDPSGASYEIIDLRGP